MSILNYTLTALPLDNKLVAVLTRNKDEKGTELYYAEVNQDKSVSSWIKGAATYDGKVSTKIVQNNSVILMIESNRDSTTTVRKLNTNLNTWIRIGILPIESSRASAILHKGRLFMVGCEGGYEVFSYSLIDNKLCNCIMHTLLPHSISRPKLIGIGESIYLLGGFNVNSSWNTVIHQLDMKSDLFGIWKIHSKLPGALAYIQADIVNEKLVLLGNYNTNYNDSVLYYKDIVGDTLSEEEWIQHKSIDTVNKKNSILPTSYIAIPRMTVIDSTVFIVSNSSNKVWDPVINIVEF